jgi:hypothetical protein
MRIAVVIVSTKRPDVLSHALYSVLRQRRLPNEVMISVTPQADLPPLPVGVGVVLSQPGSSVQRNVGVKALAARPDIVGMKRRWVYGIHMKRVKCSTARATRFLWGDRRELGCQR